MCFILQTNEAADSLEKIITRCSSWPLFCSTGLSSDTELATPLLYTIWFYIHSLSYFNPHFKAFYKTTLTDPFATEWFSGNFSAEKCLSENDEEV